jgi:hypothetical protein
MSRQALCDECNKPCSWKALRRTNLQGVSVKLVLEDGDKKLSEKSFCLDCLFKVFQQVEEV